jgi:organic hydroperoxide reductase OsmC/OhrA
MVHVAMEPQKKEMKTDYSYRVKGSWEVRRNGLISAEAVKEPKITFSPPVEFKGESGNWTPEHSLVAAVVSCFVVTFSAMAESSKLKFSALEVPAEGKLGKVDDKLISRRSSCVPR